MRVLVTGGSGFIGTNLIDDLAASGLRTLNLDWKAPRNPAHSVHWHRCDILDMNSLEAVFKEFAPSHVVHLAARTDLNGRSIADYDANTVGVRNIIEASSRLTSVRRVLFASSRLVVPTGYQQSSHEDYRPDTAYGESKVEGERIVRQFADSIAEAQWLILRPTSIWGPWFAEPYRGFFSAVQRNLYVHPRGLRIAKSFGYVENTSFQLRRLLEVDLAEHHRDTIYLADYAPIEVWRWASEIAGCFGSSAPREVPLWCLAVGARAGDMAKLVGMRNPPLTSFRLANLCTPMVHDTSPLHELVGPLPFTWEAGVRRTCEWMTAQV